MTIDELFAMPICEMYDWMQQNYHDPIGRYDKSKSYWFCTINECFPIEMPDGCGWRNVPMWSSWRDGGKQPLMEIKYEHFHKLHFAVTKISKYGECVTFHFTGTFSGGDKWRNKGATFILTGIDCNNNTYKEELYRIYLDGPGVVNNSPIGVDYEPHYDDHKGEWLSEKYKFLDKYPSVMYNVHNNYPIVKSVEKNKHSIKEYCDKLEAFAQKVQQFGKPAYDKYKDIVNDKDFIKKCKPAKISAQEIFDLWLALYIANQDVTFDDVIGMCRLSLSKEAHIKEYVKKCKCVVIEKNWNDRYTLTEDFSSYHFHNLCLLYGKAEYTKTNSFVGYLKKLDKTRELYQSLDGYKDTVKNAKEFYRNNFTDIAKKFEDAIDAAHQKVVEDLKAAKIEYLNSVKNLYDKVHTDYPGVNDSDVGIYADIDNITDNINEAFDKTAAKLMRIVNPSYNRPVKKSYDDTDDGEFSEEFKEHCKLLFDAAPELEKILYFSVYKSFDAPHSISLRDDTLDGLSDDVVYEYEEKYGQGSFDEWMEKFYELSPRVPSDWKSYGDELYPGCNYNNYITRDMEWEEVDNEE